jgi:hypothetical protein
MVKKNDVQEYCNPFFNTLFKKKITMKAIEEKLNHLNQLILDGNMMDGFDLYYHDEVVMQENELAPTVGKTANRERELQFLNNIAEFRGASVLSKAAGENITYVTWHFDYTHKEWGVRNYTQVNVQHWKDDKIVKEQFFYGN